MPSILLHDFSSVFVAGQPAMCAIFQVVFGENEQFGAVRCLIFPEETCIKEPIAEYIYIFSG